MIKIPVVFVHGIGKNGPGYSQALTRGIRREFNAVLRRILGRKVDFSPELYFLEIIWDDILAVRQGQLTEIFRKEFLRRRQKGRIHPLVWVIVPLTVAILFPVIFRNPYLFLIFVLVAAVTWKMVLEFLRTSGAAEFINDIISYRDPSAHKLIMERLREELKKLAAAGFRDVNFISHSLGTVIASDYVWEEEKAGDFFGPQVKLNNFFTMGSPLPLFSLQFGGPEMFNKPLVLQSASGRWVNIYDKEDPIAYPLKCLNDVYDRTVLKDAEVNVGWIFGLAHIRYWRSTRVARIMAHKLALDWLRQNKQLSDDEIRDLSGQYDKILML